MPMLLLNYVYYNPVGHVVEALKVAKGYHDANPGLEIEVLLNRRAPVELARACPWIRTVLQGVPDAVDCYDIGLWRQLAGGLLERGTLLLRAAGRPTLSLPRQAGEHVRAGAMHSVDARAGTGAQDSGDDRGSEIAPRPGVHVRGGARALPRQFAQR